MIANDIIAALSLVKNSEREFINMHLSCEFSRCYIHKTASQLTHVVRSEDSLGASLHGNEGSLPFFVLICVCNHNINPLLNCKI